jgi:hypothetical protein
MARLVDAAKKVILAGQHWKINSVHIIGGQVVLHDEKTHGKM